MKISAVNSNIITSFGYDKRLNTSLKNALSKYPDRVMAETILSLNDYCNLVENNLRTEENNLRTMKNNGSNSSRYLDLQDMLATSKQMLAGFVSITFPKLNYTDREYQHYNVEFVKNGSKDNDWRADVMDALSDWLNNPKLAVNSSKSKDPKKELYVPKFDEQGNEITEDDDKKQAVDTIKKLFTGNRSGLKILEEYKPTASSPKGFQDVAGMDSLKNELKDGVILAINNPEQAKLDFQEYGKEIPKAILLYGPPGCGKTYISEALAAEIKTPMYKLNISKAGSCFVNETANNIKAAFDEAAKLGENSDRPILLFMDEIDSLGFDRGPHTWPEDIKQVSTMLQCIDSVKNSNVILLAATNKYNILDPAIRRRFETKVFVDIPDFESRKALLVKNLTPLSKGQKLLSNPDDIDTIAKQLQGYSNSSICIISKAAAKNAMKRDRADINVQDYEKAIKETAEEKPNRKDYLAETKKDERKIGFKA